MNERIEESPPRIDKLEEIFSNLSTAFASAKTIEKNPLKLARVLKSIRTRVQLLVVIIKKILK